ncbi:metallophosphoesterase family protein [Isosphaeraceae bacterium EP7]
MNRDDGTMRIGLISDTHDKLARTEMAVRRLLDEGAEVLLHCGDLTTAGAVERCVGVPAYFVLGNNDYDEKGLRKAIEDSGGTCLGLGGEIEIAGRRLAITHGHSGHMVRRLSVSAPDYLFYGHTHVAVDELHGKTRWINPGALHRAEDYRAALLNLETGELTSFLFA